MSNSIFGKIYIFSIKNNFLFQKNFFIAMKNFPEAKFKLFGQINLQFLFSKNRLKSPKKIFKVLFG